MPETAALPEDSSVDNAPTLISSVDKGRQVSDDIIRLRAYEKWEADGKPLDEGIGYWLEAEKEVLYS